MQVLFFSPARLNPFLRCSPRSQSKQLFSDHYFVDELIQFYGGVGSKR